MAAKKGLGRGLSALIKDGTTEKKSLATTSVVQPTGLTKLPIDKIKRNRLQPRKHFEDAALSDLADSIRAHGVIQPLVVRKSGSSYELIAGERRLRASGLAGLKEVPVSIIEAEDKVSLEIALVENLQRENLDPMEEAEGYHVLADKFQLTQEQIATRVGKARVTITNSLRMLTLPTEIRALISSSQLASGHAKALLGLDIEAEQLLIARRCVAEDMSVRSLEKLVAKLKKPKKKARATRTDIPKEHLNYIVNKMHTHFGTSVRVSPTQTYANGKKKKGVIEIDFFSNEDLDRLLTMLDITID
jgi:ParB family chromosome partitioning protein